MLLDFILVSRSVLSSNLDRELDSAGNISTPWLVAGAEINDQTGLYLCIFISIYIYMYLSFYLSMFLYLLYLCNE